MSIVTAIVEWPSLRFFCTTLGECRWQQLRRMAMPMGVSLRLPGFIDYQSHYNKKSICASFYSIR
jgi:hypothetical protein